MAFLLFLSIAVANAQNQQGYIGDYKGAADAKAAATADMTKLALDPKCLTDLDYTDKDYPCNQYKCLMELYEEQSIFDNWFFNRNGCDANQKMFTCEIDCCKYDKYAPEDQQGGECEGYTGESDRVKPMHIFILISFLI